MGRARRVARATADAQRPRRPDLPRATDEFAYGSEDYKPTVGAGHGSK